MARTGDGYGFINGFIELVMTLFGFMVVLTPLALWVAWNEVIYFGTLATAGIGAALFCLFALLLQRLHRVGPEELDPEALRRGESYAAAMRAGRLADWDALQEDDPATRGGRMAYRDDIMRNMRLVFVTAASLLVMGGALLTGAWTYVILRFGSGGE